MASDEKIGSEEVSRRGFIGAAVGLGAGVVALTVGVPLVGAVVTTSGQATPGEYVAVADVSAIPVNEPFGVTFAETVTDAYNVETVPHSAYVLKKSDTDITVYSPVCPHLGCQVYFDRTSKQYVCPCHGSHFAENGARISGPAPRGLDTLPSKVDKGQLMVQWVQYKPGIPESVPV